MGIDTAFETVVMIRAIDAFTAPARKIAEQMGLVGAEAEALQKKLAGFKNTAFVGGAMTLTGGAIAKGLIDAADAAGNLQTSLMGVKEALKLNNDEYQKAINMSQTVGIPTIFSAEDIGKIMQSMGTSGLSKEQVMDPNILKEYVSFADVQAQVKKENAPDVVGAAVKMAHQYQLYSTEQIEPFLNELNGALLHSNSTASEFQTTFKYISNQARSMGVSADNTLAITAWLDRMGLGNGRGGTNFADFLQRSIYHSSGKKADEAMVTAGFVQNGHSVFEDAQGNFVGIPQAVQIMQDFAKRFNNNANLMNPLLQAIFGTQGARVAQLMTSSGAAEQFTNVQGQIAGTENINTTQDEFNKTWQGKTKQLQTTLQDIKQAFGFNEKSVLYPLLADLDDILAKVLEFEQAHPEIVKWIATFTSIAAAVLLVVGPITLLAGVIGYLNTANMFVNGFKLLGSAAKGSIGPVAGLAAVAFLLYQAWKYDPDFRETVKWLFDYIKSEIPKAIKNVKDFAKDIGLIDDKGHLTDTAKLIGEIGIAILAGKGATDLLSGAMKAFTLITASNPWLAMIAALLLIITHWQEIKKAVDDAAEAVRKFLGTDDEHTKEKQTENAYQQFNEGKNVVEHGAIVQYKPGFWGSVGDKLRGIQNWVKGYATGTDYFSGGLAVVGEKGPELVNLPGGSQIIPNHRLTDLVPSKGGDYYAGSTINIYPTPNQSADEIADRVMAKLTRKTRNQTWSRPTRVIPGVR